MSNSYNDIEQLLSHEALDTFHYQTFKRDPVFVSENRIPTASERPVAQAQPIEKAEVIPFPDLARSDGRPQRMAASKAFPIDAQSESSASEKPTHGIRDVFQRLTRAIQVAPNTPVVLDLHLPERAPIAREVSKSSRLSQLPVEQALERMLAASEQHRAPKRLSEFAWASAS